MEAFLYNHKSWDDTALKEETNGTGTHTGGYYIRYPRRFKAGGGTDFRDLRCDRTCRRFKRFEIEGVKFIMAHERTQIPGSLGDAQVVVFGHSHMYQQQEINGRLWLNPGSCGYKRGTLPLSMAVMTIENGAYTLETIWLEKGYGTPEDAIAKREKPKKNRYERQQKRHMQEKKDKEMLFLIAKILRLYQADASRAWVVKNTGNDPELTAKIYDLCGMEETSDAHRILAKLKEGI